MTEDRRDLRARRLLRLGSGAGAAGASGAADTAGAAGAVGAPGAGGLRPGFMQRLRARIEAEERAAAAAGAAGREPADFLGALGALARPALGLAFAVALLSGVFLLLSPSAPAGASGEGGDTLAALVEEDPALSALFGSEAGGVWPAIEAAGSGGEAGEER